MELQIDAMSYTIWLMIVTILGVMFVFMDQRAAFISNLISLAMLLIIGFRKNGR